MKKSLDLTGLQQVFPVSKRETLLRLFLGFCLLLLGVQGKAQTGNPPTKDWEFATDFGGSKDEINTNVLPLSDGGCLMIGYTYSTDGDLSGRTGSVFSDAWVVKVKQNSKVWKKWYSGALTGNSKLYDVVEVSDGFVLTGRANSNAWVLKIDKSNGSQIWSVVVPRPACADDAEAVSLVPTGDGGFFIGANILEEAGSCNAGWVFKINSTGTKLFERYTYSGNWGKVKNVLKTNDGYIVTGWKDKTEPTLCSGYTTGRDVWACKVTLTTAVNVTWSNLYGGNTYDDIKDAVATSYSGIQDNGCAILGYTPCLGAAPSGPQNVGTYHWLLRLNANGSTRWARSINPLSSVVLNGLTIACDDKFVLAATSNSITIGMTRTTLQKFDTTGLKIWETAILSNDGLEDAFDAVKVKRTADNGYALSGIHQNLVFSHKDYWIVKTKPDPSCSANYCGKAVTVTCGQYLGSQTSTGQTNAISAYSSCSTVSFPAGDKIYKIVLGQTSDLQIGLEILQSGLDLDLFLLGNNCATVTCLDASLTSNSSTNKEGIVKNLTAGTYYIAVDGSSGSGVNEGSFNIDFACGEISCANAVQLYCGTAYAGTTANNATNNVSIYKLADAALADDVPNKRFDVLNAGPEKVHKFILTEDKTVTITLSGLTTDLELFLLDQCTKNRCIAKSTNDGTTTETITKFLVKGTYYVVVDGYQNKSGSYTLKADWSCCPTPPANNFDCASIRPVYSGTGTDLKFTFTHPQAIAAGYKWKINGVDQVNGTTSTLIYTFPTPGTYDICFPYLSNGCVEYCCMKFCVANPFDCDRSIIPVAATNGYQFQLSNGSAYTNIRWWDDYAQQAITGGTTTAVIPALTNCGNVQPRTISVSYYDGNCYRLCCTKYNPCSPYECYPFDYDYIPVSSGYKFTLNVANASNISWYDAGTGQNLGSNTVSNILIAGTPCAEHTIAIRYYLNGVWYICYRKVWICDPFVCQDIGWDYIPVSSGFQFSLAATGASSISWTDDSGQNLGNNAVSSILPVPGTCVERTIKVRYYVNGHWVLCCRKIWLCNPYDCTDFGYDYIPVSNTFRFNLNVANSTGIAWTDETGQNFGTSAVSADIPVPPGGCAFKTIKVRYYANGRWYCCIRKIWFCNPFDCAEFDFGYYPVNNGYRFTLAQTGATNISWRDDYSGQSLGTNSTSDVLTIDATCEERTITVRYYWNGSWYICCRKVWICNPNNCAVEITPYWLNGGSQVQLSVNSNYQNVDWHTNSGTFLGAGNPVVIPNPGQGAIACAYYKDAQGIAHVCCTTIDNPASGLALDVDDASCSGAGALITVPVRVRNFKDVTTFQSTVKIVNSSVAKFEGIENGVLGGSNLSTVIDNSTAGLLWYHTDPVTQSDGSIALNLKIRLLGSGGQSTELAFNNSPVQILAEQLINNVATQVVPQTFSGSVCISSNFSLSGQILREDNLGVGNVTVNLTGTSTQSTTTDANGRYSFASLPAGGNYTITPVKDINDRNGITGGDLVVLQKHILGQEPLPTPYRWISADANNSSNISGGDLVTIQRLILGTDLVLPSNTSWRFVPQNFIFPNPANPWQTVFSETFQITSLSGNVANADFVGIKIADPNLSNNPANLTGDGNDDRMGELLGLQILNPVSIGSNRMELPVAATLDCDLESVQFSLKWTDQSLIFKTLSDGILTGFTTNNYRFVPGETPRLALVWASPDGRPVPLKSGEILFKLVFEKTGDWQGAKANWLTLTDTPTPNEVTLSGNKVGYVGLEYAAAEAVRQFRHNIQPNPFSEVAMLTIDLPEADDLTITAFNSTGQQVFQKTGSFDADLHQFQISCPGCHDGEVIFYTISGARFKGAGKAVFVKK